MALSASWSGAVVGVVLADVVGVVLGVVDLLVVNDVVGLDIGVVVFTAAPLVAVNCAHVCG